MTLSGSDVDLMSASSDSKSRPATTAMKVAAAARSDSVRIVL
jgi:hypothetical protein